MTVVCGRRDARLRPTVVRLEDAAEEGRREAPLGPQARK